MSITNTSAIEIYKRKYLNKGPIDLVPGDDSALLRKFKFREAEGQIGDKFVASMRLRYPKNVVYTAAGTTPSWTSGSYTEGVIKQALVDGSNMVLFDAIDYEAVAKAKNKDTAVENAIDVLTYGLSSLGVRRMSCELLHGRRGLAEIESVGTVSGSGPYTRTAVITEKTWSEGIAAELEGAPIDIWDSTLANQLNGNAALGATNAGIVTVTAVDFSTRTLTLSSSGNGTTNGTDGVGVAAAGAHIFFQEASPTTEFLGLDGIARSATGTTIYGLSATTYSLLQGNVKTSQGQLSIGKLMNWAGTLTNFGARGTIMAIISNSQFELLNSEQSSLRSYQSAGGRGENGFNSLRFHCQAGTLEIMPSLYQKNGLVHMAVEGEGYRIGAQDLAFQKRGQEDKLIHEVAGYAASEMRMFANQALFVEAPKRTLVAEVTPV